jgi:hypothetical protein
MNLPLLSCSISLLDTAAFATAFAFLSFLAYLKSNSIALPVFFTFLADFFTESTSSVASAAVSWLLASPSASSSVALPAS